MATTPSNGPKGKDERAAIIARLEQIANELTFPGLSPRQAEALERERFTLTGQLADESQTARFKSK